MIYFIQGSDGGPVKIGYARSDEHVMKRRAQLQPGNPQLLQVLHIIAGGFEKEQELHERFASSRIRGEWFEPTEDLLRLANHDLASRAFRGDEAARRELILQQCPSWFDGEEREEAA